ncbi:hypothetical protein TIFTF001_020686 [Ficus carica]|uniref:Uncharacterized protein n=1 Tax=Ficus carica TaxID=3494 RepID=A0AA88A921_FICCA|nr:hypothetical protein TIFTF001_020686 [Ficus carica]
MHNRSSGDRRCKMKGSDAKGRWREMKAEGNFAMSSGEVLELLWIGFLPPPHSEVGPQGQAAAREGEVFLRR